VRRVDKDAKKVTIKHGPLANLDMPAMTMVFQVKDPALLDKVKAGDKVKFQAEKIAGGYAVTKIERAP
jgi:Cu/Ag efflux protein CusF